MSGYGRDSIASEPSVAYSILSRAIGEETLKALAQPNHPPVTPEQKRTVLMALNDQRLTTSRLIEQPCITYRDEERFHLSVCCPISDDFWVSKLLRNLMHDGVILRAADHRHLVIKESLTEREERQVEWLHIGVMNFLYGNLLEKRDYHFSKELGDGWYFECN
jgi:hypothetical protein